MGGLSRKRMKPRIVKKQKLKNVKRIHSTKLEPYLRKFWEEGKSLQENYERLGLQLRQNPSLKHSMEGKVLRKMALKKSRNPEKAEDVEWANIEDLKQGDNVANAGDDDDDSDVSDASDDLRGVEEGLSRMN